MDEASAPNAPPPEVMWTIAQVAERDGVSKPTVSVHVKRLVERQGLTVTRDKQGRVALLNVVEYDRLREQTGDPSKAQAPERPAPAAPSRPTHLTDLNSYDEALRRKTWHEAERRRLELAEKKGALIRRDLLAGAVEACAESVVQTLDRLPQAASDLALAVTKDGEHGLRLALKGIAAKLKTAIAHDLAVLAAAAPTSDPELQEDDAGGGVDELA